MKESEGFPRLSGKESACQCRGHGFDPWSGKIPHPMEQQSPCAATAEPACLEPMLCTRGGTATRSLCTATRGQPQLAATRESLCVAMKTQHIQI